MLQIIQYFIHYRLNNGFTCVSCLQKDEVFHNKPTLQPRSEALGTAGKPNSSSAC